MKFALIGGERQSPQPAGVGTCPACGAEVTSKCGTIRVWHWAHKARMCDPWWEPETEWHRTWKNMFPESWQEVPLRAPDGELHIADLRTPAGLVIEFQHSAIKPQERAAREAFYQNMLWVVDGTRLKRDLPRIDENLPGWRRLADGIIELTAWPDAFLPKQWLDCPVPVVFDFQVRERDEPDDRLEAPAGQTPAARRRMERTADRAAHPDPLICLLPGRFRDRACYFAIPREALVKIAHGEATIFDWRQTHQRLAEAMAMAASRVGRGRRY